MPRKQYEPCKRHKKTYCADPTCKREEQEDSSRTDAFTTDITTSLLLGPLSTTYTDPGC